MAISRAREAFWAWGPFGGGVTFFPYQLSLGLTLRYWPCIYAPSIRIHVGPLKVWLYVSFKPKGAGDNIEEGGATPRYESPPESPKPDTKSIEEGGADKIGKPT